MEGRERTAILIDGDEFFRVGVSDVLRKEHAFTNIRYFDVYDAALNVSDNETVVLIVVEAALLDWGGNQLRLLRMKFPAAQLAVTSLSRNRDLALRSIDGGAHGYVLKGSISDLATALRLILDGFIWLPRFVSCLMPAVSPHHELRASTELSSSNVLSCLTTRQIEVLEMVVQGKSNKEIARLLQLREGTIKVHMAGLFRNLQVANRSSAAVLGARLLSRPSLKLVSG